MSRHSSHRSPRSAWHGGQPTSDVSHRVRGISTGLADNESRFAKVKIKFEASEIGLSPFHKISYVRLPLRKRAAPIVPKTPYLSPF